MQEFTAKHRDEIRGVLSGFDRLVFTERYLDALAEVDDDTTLGRDHPAPGTASAGERTQRRSPRPWSTVTISLHGHLQHDVMCQGRRAGRDRPRDRQ